MAKYKIEIKKSAVKEINRLVGKDLKSVLTTIEQLGEEPRPYGSQKLSGYDKYRIRCGNYRILYEVKDALRIVGIVKVGHRKSVYREL